jgi:DNA repair protein RadC
MVVKNRDTGIGALGSLPWGSHICVFYGTTQDLVDTLVPYFKAGLENNEFCVWITAPLFGKKRALTAISNQIPDLNRYLKAGQLEFTPYTTAYLKDGVFNMQKALYSLAYRTKQAFVNGYGGMRVAGYVAYLKMREWQVIINFERQINKYIVNTPTLGLCAYPLDKCNASQFIDVIGNHRYAFIVHRGETMSLRTKTAREMRRSLSVGGTAPLTPLMMRFAVSGLKDFTDPEIIELFLSLCPYRRQKYPLSQIIKRFKNIRGLLTASSEELKKAGFDYRCIDYIKLFREIPKKVLEEKIKEEPIYKSPRDIFDYLYYSMRDLKKEVFKAIYLDSRNQIISTGDLFRGTLDKITINAREVVEFAVTNNARSLIFVHNHPSGDPTPSRADKKLTRDLVFIGSLLQIRVLDHIIIGENRYFSFAREGLIQDYETDFLSLRLTGTSKARKGLSRIQSSGAKKK